MRADPVGAPDYYKLLERVERRHWWFIALRELVTKAVTLRMPGGSRILDIGCSTGHVIAALPDEYERTGVDISSGAIEFARTIRPQIRFVEAPVENLPFKAGSFDCVIALDVLSARGVEHDHVALREINRVLRPGGVLVVQVAAYEWLRSDYDDFPGRTARRYTASSLRDLLLNGGFRAEHLSYRITALFPIAAARRLLAPSAGADDLSVPRPRLNRLLTAATKLEARIVGKNRLPFGLSVFAVANS